MIPLELSTKLYNAGFNSREAGDIVLWMAEPFNYSRVQGLAVLEDVYKERVPEEEVGEMKPAEYRNRIVFLEKIIKECYQRIDLLKQLNDLYYERPATRQKKRVGIIID